jgi:hypothetical protein
MKRPLNNLVYFQSTDGRSPDQAILIWQLFGRVVGGSKGGVGGSWGVYQSLFFLSIAWRTPEKLITYFTVDWLID